MQSVFDTTHSLTKVDEVIDNWMALIPFVVVFHGDASMENGTLREFDDSLVI